MKPLSLKFPISSTPRHGAIAMLEFVIAVPVLILLIIVLFEFGKLYYVYMRFTEINWEGARFFSSLKSPPPACISPQTTNLPYVNSNYVDTISNPAQKSLYQFHRIVQERVLSMFLYRSDSWPIESDGLVPGMAGIMLKELPLFANMPTISTQYIESNATQGCPEPSGATFLAGDLDNTVTVCLEANYKGPFFSLPIKTCSTTHLLENNENLRLPQKPSTTRTTR